MSSSELLQIFDLFLNLVGGIGGAALINNYAYRQYRRYRRRRSFFGDVHEQYKIVVSRPQPGLVRESDNNAVSALSEAARKMRIELGDDKAVSEVFLNDIGFKNPLLLIGSTKYNPLVDDFQRRIDSPFQFVSFTPELSPKKSRLCIYEKTGQVYTCTSEPILGEEEQGDDHIYVGDEYDYGILLVGKFEIHKGDPPRWIIWAGGIHGPGTLAVVKWALDNLQIYDWKEVGNVCFLIRGIAQSHTENMGGIRAELVSGPCEWQQRPKSGRVGLLCDMGNVLLSFDRNHLERNLRDAFNVQLTDEQYIKTEALRRRFERGDLNEDEFIEELKGILGLTEGDDALREAWCDIFERNEDVIQYLQQLSKQASIRLVLVSNTDSLRLKHAMGRLGLSALFDDDRIVVSYQDGVSPKGENNTMFREALNILRKQFGTEEFEAVLIDDMRQYLLGAQIGGSGIKGIHYRTFPQLVYELRKYGVYLAMSHPPAEG